MKYEFNHRGTEAQRRYFAVGRLCVLCASVVLFLFFISDLNAARAAEPPTWISGADISALPMMEREGAVYRDRGKAEDALAILSAHGCNLFRIRLFVSPQTDFAKSGGAAQDLNYVTALAKRVKGTGGKFLLDIHYSDTWADPGKQFTPKAWKDLDFDALKSKVGEYTTSVMNDLGGAGVLPDMVQVGNEITSGMLWPTAKVWGAPPDRVQTQWDHFAELFNAGAAAVHAFKRHGQSIPVVLHIDGGGKVGRTKWFLTQLQSHPFDYDILALSFYPAWGDSIDALKQNLADAIAMTDKNILIAETSYPWHPLPDIRSGTNIMRWPTTPAGQEQFLHDLNQLLRGEPKNRGMGFVYWYPEAISVHGMRVWRQGYEALFDEHGKALPALGEFRAGR